MNVTSRGGTARLEIRRFLRLTKTSPTPNPTGNYPELFGQAVVEAAVDFMLFCVLAVSLGVSSQLHEVMDSAVGLRPPCMWKSPMRPPLEGRASCLEPNRSQSLKKTRLMVEE